MSQQVNLYSPIFRRQKKYFSAAAMLQSVLAVLLGVAALSLYARMQVQSFENQSRSSQDALKRATAQLRAAAEEVTGEDKVKAIEAKIKEADSRLAERRQLVEALDRLTGARQQDYSEYLRAFARQTLDGVWLRAIRLDQDQDVLSITGRALRAELVPAYIDHLRKEPLFKGRGFNRLDISAVKQVPESGKDKAAAPGAVEFSLSSSQDGRKEPEQ